MRLRRLILSAAATWLLAGAAAAADEAPPTAAAAGLVVNCYDQARNVVTRDLASRCRGIVVDDAEAQKIQDQRSRAILQGIAPRISPGPAGTRLARIGTAFFVDESGKLVTNNHVVAGCTAMVVEPSVGDALPAKVVAVDAHDDLALLQTATKAPAVAPFRARAPTEAGAFIAAVGYPYQGLPPREPIVTPGVLSEPIEGSPWGERMVMKGNVEPGDSGGPVLDRYGLVIGIVNAKANTVAIYRRTGRVISDVGIGIPLSTVLAFLKTNGAAYRTPAEGNVLGAAQILDHARGYVARADCWK